MIGALIILLFTILVGLGLYLHDKHRHPKADNAAESVINSQAVSSDANADSECCGMHQTCEKDTLLAFTNEADYYDDEELDRFAGRSADEYSDAEIEEFRDVLFTLRSEEVAPWARSITLRGVTLPSIIKEEMLMLVAERRSDAASVNRS